MSGDLVTDDIAALAADSIANMERVCQWANRERAAMEHEMSAVDYAAMNRPDVEPPAEINSADYVKTYARRRLGAGRNLDSSDINTDTPAKVDFAQWLELVLPGEVVPEYVFLPNRKFRADWAVPVLGIVFEYDGRTHHGTVTGSERDAEKSNLAQLAGWLFIRVNAASLKDGSGYIVAERAIDQRLERLGRILR